MQAINFFQFNTVKIFNAINAGTGLGLATPLTTVYSDAERLYEPIKWDTFQMRTPTSLQRQARVK